MAYTLLGQDFVPPDVRAKVTGEAKYAEDFRADGMVFCRLLHSTMPHARVTRIDASEALAMDGVVAVLTADDLPELPAPGQPLLTNEPMFAGEPILAVAGTWRPSNGRPPISPPSRKDNSRPVSPRTSGPSVMSRGTWPKPRS